MGIVGTICTLVLMATLILVIIYQIRTDLYNREKMFELQIEMAKGQAALTKDLTWDELKKIINDIISFRVSNYIMTNHLMGMKNDELSIMWTAMMGELCTLIEMSLSEEIKRQSFKFVTKKYFTQFVKNSVEITLVYQLETNRENPVNNRLTRIRQADNLPKGTEPAAKNTKK